MSVTHSQPARRGLVRPRFKPATSWRAGLLGDAAGHIRVNGEYVWIRLGNATSNRLVMAYLDRRDTQNDTLLPAAGTTVFVDQEQGIWRVRADGIWQA